MAANPLFSAYFAATGSDELGRLPADLAPRPQGPVIWAICSDVEDCDAVETLRRRLLEDGEDASIVVSLPSASDADHFITPQTRRGTKAFLRHFQPRLVLWFGDRIAPATVFEIGQWALPLVLVEATANALSTMPGRRVLGLLRHTVQQFSAILTIRNDDMTAYAKAGADAKTTRAIGTLEDTLPPPPCDEEHRTEIVGKIGYRPLWYAADLPLNEIEVITSAYRHAARRAHRTLLVITPRAASDVQPMKTAMEDDGLNIACQYLDEYPKDATQVYFADRDDGMALWSRVSPITYLGGSFSDGDLPDPFVPAMLGSAIISGPACNSHRIRYQRLLNGAALKQIVTANGLGRGIEDLLATNLAAQQAHAAWDVTSHGSDATNDLMSEIYTHLDQVKE